MSNQKITSQKAETLNPNFIRQLYDWVLHWAKTPYGVLALFLLAFAESSFFPIPPDALLIALCMGAYRKWAWFAVACTVGSLFGGLAGYGIGYFLSDSVGELLLQWIGALVVHGGSEMSGNYLLLADRIEVLAQSKAQFMALAEQIKQVGQSLAASESYKLSAVDKALWLRGEALTWFNGVWGPWAVGIAGFTPIPYKVFTITSGMFEMSIGPFIIASLFGRAGRFFLVAGIIGLTYRFYGDRINIFIDRYFNWLAIAFVLLIIGGFFILKLL
jgi:membrane protein YqaA with SNARE-associated domain